MSIIATLFSKLFARTPAHHESAYGPFYSAVVARLTRAGVTVGRTAFYPRIEVHSITESERLDKEGQLRQFQFTVESIGNASLAATAAMNEANIELLTSEISLPEGWRCLGIIPGLLQDLTESADSAKIIYRLLQGFTAWVELVKPAPEPVVEPGTGAVEEPGGNAEPDNPGTDDPDGPVEEEPATAQPQEQEEPAVANNEEPVIEP